MPITTRDLTRVERAIFEEHAAINEFEALQPRAVAEKAALAEIVKMRQTAVAGKKASER